MELSQPSVLSRLRSWTQRPGRLCLAVATVGLVLAGGVAGAAPSESAAVVTGCYDTTNGQLRVVDANTACRRSETRISWNQQGPAGPQGDPGPQGDAGPQGDPGPAGEAVSSFDDLDGLTCRAGDPLEGVIEMSYGPAGAVSFSCIATALEDLTVQLAGGSAGFVSSSPAGINCGADCTESFRRGTTVQLTATPGGGSFFAGWSGACSGTTPTCSVTLDAARSVTATFVPLALLEVEVRNPLTPFMTFGTSVVRGPGTFSCSQKGYGSNVCTLTAPATGPITLRAEADLTFGNEFGDWSWPCSEGGPVCTFFPRPGFNPRITATFSG